MNPLQVQSTAQAKAILCNLDGYMAAAGYDTDHPWRREISTALVPSAKVEAQEAGILVVHTPFGLMQVARTEACDHASMRARQLSGLLALMSGADEADDMLRLCARIGEEVAESLRRFLRDRTSTFDDELALQTRQIAHLLVAVQPEDGPSEILWLAQQLANELGETVAWILEVGGAS